MKKLLLFFVGLFVSSYALAQDLTIVDDLATYTGTDATVFSKADGNVYKYNSKGLYEQYGVYEVVDFTAPQATEVEYITNAGNSDLIIPDYRPKANTRVFATVEIASMANGRRGVFGTREFNNGWPNAFYFETVSDNKVHAKLGNEGEFATDGTSFVGVKSVFDLNGATGQSNVYVNGATIASHTWTRWADDYDYKYFLSFFAVRQNNTACYNYQPAGMKLYGAKIYEGNTLVMDLVPVVTSNGKGGLKDRLTGSIYTNGNGTISASGSYSVSGADKGVSTYEGKLVYNTADNHMYHWNGSAWEDKGLGLQEISDTKYYKFYDNTANAWNWFYPSATYDNTFAGYTTDVSATYGARANHNDAQIGAGGYEPLQYNFTCFESGANYRLSFDFTTGGFSSWSGDVRYLPLYLYAGNYGNVGSWGYTSDHINDANTWAYVQVPFNAQSDWHIARNFTATGDKAAFIFQFGAVADGGDGFKFWFDNMYIQKYLYPATYPAISLTSAIDALLEEAEAWTEPMTTDNYWAELSTAKADAETYKADADLIKQKEVLDALQTALDHVNAVGDITYLRPTITLANAEGIDTSDAEAFVVNGTTSGVPVLNALRVARQIKAKGHHDAFTGSEPTVGETYYLYNVGQGLFLCPSLVGSHELALGFAGDPLTLESNTTGGYQLKGTIRADKYIGHQWGSQGFFDGAANAAATNWYFFPVTGTTNVYNISKADNTNNGNLLGYAPEATPTYGIGERDGSQDWGMRVLHNRSGVDDAKNQWIFVTKAERDALLETATAANGVDATYYIVDPAIDHGHALQSAWQASEGDLDVWGDFIQYTPADANFCITDEGVSISQELTGLKPGIYSVGVQAVYMHPSDFSLSNAELFATNGAGETKTQAIAARNAGLDQVPGMGVLKAEGWLPASNRFINYWSGDGYNGAAYYFHYGQYWNEVANVIVGEDGTLTIGVKKNAAVANDAFVIDNFRLTYYGPAPMDMTLTNGFATFSADKAYEIMTDGVSAYQAIDKQGSNIVLSPLTGIIPANTGVVLYGEGQTSVTLNPTGTAATDDFSSNMMRPHVEAGVVPAEADGCKNYLLTKDEAGTSCIFRPSSGKGTFKANRAYLALPIGSGAKDFSITFEDDVTGIKNVNGNANANVNSVVYDLQGRKVADKSSSLISHPSSRKGVYIVNGKKIVIK